MTDAETGTTTETVETETTGESVEQEEAQQPETQEAESAEQSGEETPDPEAEKKRNAVQERISQLTRQRKEAEREAQETRQELEEVRKQLQEAQGEKDPRPKLEDFDYDEDKHAEALDQWYTRQNERSAEQGHLKRLEKQAQKKAQQAQEAMVQSFQERSKSFAEEYEDYYQTIQNPAFQTGRAIMQAVLTSENGPAIAYHLGKNTQLANEINSMPEQQALMELGRIEAKLTQSVGTQSSKAPEPIKPVGDKAPVEKDPEKMTPEEYARMRWKQKGLIK